MCVCRIKAKVSDGAYRIIKTNVVDFVQLSFLPSFKFLPKFNANIVCIVYQFHFQSFNPLLSFFKLCFEIIGKITQAQLKISTFAIGASIHLHHLTYLESIDI